MSATLTIQVCAGKSPASEELPFYTAESWTSDTEKQLVARMQDLLGVLRNIGESFEIKVNLQVSNTSAALFLIRKKCNNEVAINNSKLSIREIEVLGLIMQGLTNNEIAEKLFISYETVKSHRKNILEKTGAKNTAALISYYHQTFFEK